MKRQIAMLAGGIWLVVAVILALPSRSNASRQHSHYANTQVDEKTPHLKQGMAQVQEMLDDLPQRIDVLSAFDDGASWLGVEIGEVTANKVKELKLPAERGVVLTEIVPDSPATKAGLKAGDVVTELNGQHIEGAAQFRRFIRETPSGRAIQLTIWRDGRAQTISATLGQAEQGRRVWSGAMPQDDTFFKAPMMPRIEMPRFELGGDGFLVRRGLVLGITADNLSGQLGAYFGAPDGEGVLVREVRSGSPAEKGGVKAGDVITKVDGDRVRTVEELRDKLFGKISDKSEKKTVSVALLRDRKEMTVNVEVERPQQAPVKVRKLVGNRRTI